MNVSRSLVLVVLLVVLLIGAYGKSALAAPPADACLGARQDKLADVLKDRNQENYLIGQRIPVEQIKLQRFLRLDRDRGGPLARFDSQTSHPLFSEEGVSLYLVNLWGTACKPCKEELPLLIKTWRGLAADPGVHKSVRLLLLHEEAVVMPEVLSDLMRAEPDIGTRAALYADSNAMLREMLDQKPYSAPSLPTTLLVDRGGVIRQAFIGTLFNREAALVHAVKHLLSRPPPPVCLDGAGAAAGAAGGQKAAPPVSLEQGLAQLSANVGRVSAIVRALDEKQKTEDTLSPEDKSAVIEFWQRVGIERPHEFQIGDKTRSALQKLLGQPAPAAGHAARPSDG
jgi:hypothetical protein